MAATAGRRGHRLAAYRRCWADQNEEARGWRPRRYSAASLEAVATRERQGVKVVMGDVMEEEIGTLQRLLNDPQVLPSRYLRRNVVQYELVSYVNQTVALWISGNWRGVAVIPATGADCAPRE